MIKGILLGWFIIQFADFDIETNRCHYLVVDPVHNHYISFDVSEKLRYDQGAWIKLKMEVECEVIEQPQQGLNKIIYLCNADKVEEVKCKRPFVINGKEYC